MFLSVGAILSSAFMRIYDKDHFGCNLLLFWLYPMVVLVLSIFLFMLHRSKSKRHLSAGVLNGTILMASLFHALAIYVIIWECFFNNNQFRSSNFSAVLMWLVILFGIPAALFGSVVGLLAGLVCFQKK